MIVYGENNKEFIKKATGTTTSKFINVEGYKVVLGFSRDHSDNLKTKIKTKK